MEIYKGEFMIITRKERVKKTIGGEEVDCTPFHTEMTSCLMESLATYYKVSTDRIEHLIGNHLLYINFQYRRNYKPVKPSPNLEIDEFGVTWDMKKIATGDWGMVKHALNSPVLSKYNWPDAYAEGRFEHIPDLVDKNPDRFNVLNSPGIFDTCWHIRGFENFFMDMVSNTKFLNEMLDKALEFIIGLIETFPPQIDGFRFIGDWGKQKGLLMSKKHWDEFLKPRLKKAYEACKKRNVAIMVHSCGDIVELIPELIDLGVDVLDPIQPEAMDISFLKKEYGKYLTFLGGLGSQSTIPKGTSNDVRKEFEKTLKILGNGDGYIIGPAGALPTDVPVENVVALIEACHNICPTF